MPVLRVTGIDRVQLIQRFMDHLLLLRDRSNLEMCLLDFVGDSSNGDEYVKLWIRHALLCQVRKLIVAGTFLLDNLHFVSQYLTELHLDGVTLRDKCTDFSSCLALKHLEMTNCDIHPEKFYSRPLEWLNLQGCFFPMDLRTHISAPSLISLQLINFGGRTPFFEHMLVLVTTEATFDPNYADSCNNNDPGYCEDASCHSCYGIGDGGAGSVLLSGFSAARSLKLIAEPKMRCVTDDHRALICILQHSPVRKKLTLQLYKKQKPKSLVPSKAIFNSVDVLFLHRTILRELKSNVSVSSVLVSAQWTPEKMKI
ncbi:hypothetical protein EJB05_28888 [Eragrostis curvula]|uniref:FBD domain-containing protein n=1 Tax=Eragrostis curvula TaxID=38414 RepID=A0A5J9UT95_9POAL|nr:hypothetical protein EJB05_28888 [Eragrostis curvula]